MSSTRISPPIAAKTCAKPRLPASPNRRTARVCRRRSGSTGDRPLHTTLGICVKKARYRTEQEALAVALRADITLRPYRCALCRQYHLTSRTKGKRIPRPDRREEGIS